MSSTPSGPPNDARPAADPYAQRQHGYYGGQRFGAPSDPEPAVADPIVWDAPEASSPLHGWQGPAAFEPEQPQAGPAQAEQTPEESAPRTARAEDKRAPEQRAPAQEAAAQEAPEQQKAPEQKAPERKTPRDPTPVPPSAPPASAPAEPAPAAGHPPEQAAAESDDVLTIGRSKTNSIVLDDMLVSRRHLRIAADDEGLVLEDLGSRNGTFVNGRRVQRTHLHEGDRIGVGSSTFEVRDGWLVSV